MSRPPSQNLVLPKFGFLRLAGSSVFMALEIRSATALESLRYSSPPPWHEFCILFCVNKSVVVLTSGKLDLSAIIAGANAFGWNVLMLNRIRSIDTLPLETVAAILFDRDAVGGTWPEAASRLRRIAPKVPLIACHHITETLDWPAVCDAGAFHGVSIPLNESEVRQSFGYVWAAMQRDGMSIPARPSVAVCVRQTAA